MQESVISVKNVTKSFRIQENIQTYKSVPKSIFRKEDKNYHVVLEDISFEVSKGDTIGIIGLNGCGKTTLLKLISSIYLPNSGTIDVRGKISPLLQIGTGFQNDLGARDNIIIYGRLLGLTNKEIKGKIEKIIDFAELHNYKDLKLKNYSAGMRARLGFSTALQINPDILLVDEILSVGDESFRRKSFAAFTSFKNDNKTILFTTHNMNFISKLSDRVLLLDKGRVVMMAKPSEVIPYYQKKIIQSE